MSKFIANSFQLPNAFVDEMLCKLSGNACKIYLLIVRKTRGWHKEADRISYSQIQKATGIGSYSTIDKALSELANIGLIFVKSGNEKTANEYRLNDELPITKTVKGTTENEVDGATKTVKATTETVKGGITETVNTEIHSFKNTNQKYKREYDAHTHESQTAQDLQNSKKSKATAKNSSAKKFITADELIDLGVDNQIANDYLTTRKTKLTQTAINLIIKQCQLANIDLNSALEFCIEHSWQSFKADWYFNRQSKQNHPPTNRMDELRHMANTNPTNVFVDDLPPNFLGASHE